jgi:hypothetical protein
MTLSRVAAAASARLSDAVITTRSSVLNRLQPLVVEPTMSDHSTTHLELDSIATFALLLK